MLYFSIIMLFFGLTVWSIYKDMEDGLFLICVTLVVSSLWLVSYSEHATNIATIQEQHRVINVYHKRMDSLTERLTNLSQGDVKTALLNADTPIAALVSSITDMELRIAQAEEKKAKAYQSITARKLGLMSSVTWFFRDIE